MTFLISFLISLISREFISQQLRFGAAGLIATGVNYATFWTLLALVGVGGIMATGVAFGMASSVNFLLQRSWTFRNRPAMHGSHARNQMIAYAIMTACSFGLNYSLFIAFAELAHIGYWPTEILLTLIVSAFGYFCTKLIFTSPRLAYALARSR